MRRAIAVVALLCTVVLSTGVAYAGGAVRAGTARQDPPIVAYSSIPTTLPGNVISAGFEALNLKEFGDYVGLAAAGPLESVTVTLSSQACQFRPGGVCTTTPGAFFTHPITANLYTVDTATNPPSVGSLLATATLPFNILYRPSADPAHCGAGSDSWFSPADNRCFSGLAQNITFPAAAFSALPNLPSQVIWTVTYNTTRGGYNPIGMGAACFSTPQGCPYDALNVGADSLGSPQAFVGTDVEPDSVFLNSPDPTLYCGGPGVNTLADAVGCWAGNRPMARIQVAQGTTGTSLSASPTNPQLGQPVTLSATVTCSAGVTPTGTVTFFEGATPVGTVPLNGSGAASLTVNGLSGGSHTFTAQYGGDANCAGSTSPPVTVTVGCVLLSGVHIGPLLVRQPTCLAPGTHVFGPVTVAGAGALDAEGTSIAGPLTVTGGTGLRLCASDVAGFVAVSGVNGVVVAGDAGDDGNPPCRGNTVVGPVRVAGNTGFVEVGGNRIVGPLTVNGNTTSIPVPPENAAATEIEANLVFGFLACTGNTPPPTNDGRPNTVVGFRTGQCSGL
jgi:hypothetical protein